jgi:hypothetical protein
MLLRVNFGIAECGIKKGINTTKNMHFFVSTYDIYTTVIYSINNSRK